jgi:transcriptional antiterminator RfaH
MMAWYAVYTNARMENWARSNLWERGFEVYLPQYRKQRRHARKVDMVTAPLFPRYLFVRADLEAGDRRHIVTARGVASLVAFGERAAPIRDDIIAEIRSREDADGHIRLCDPAELAPGDKVRLHSGAMQDAIGIFDCASDKDRVLILLNLMGRAVRVTVSADSVSRVA